MNADPTVRRHLLDVVATLRREGPRSAPRTRLLDRLEAYARAGRFPRHDRPAPVRARRERPARAFEGPGARMPRFRDAQGTWCAVGHLVAATDPVLAQRVARDWNDCWVAEIDEPALADWARRHGFTVAELEWIQPEYLCDHYDHCTNVAFHEAAPPATTTCAGGPDPTIAASDEEWFVACATCDEDFRVWVAVQNPGGVRAEGVVLDLVRVDYYSTPYEVEVLDRIDGVAVDAGTTEWVGPLSSSSLWVTGVRLSSPDDCNPYPESTMWPWQWEGGNGGGMRWPRECGGDQCPTSDPVDPGGHVILDGGVAVGPPRGCDPAGGPHGVGLLGVAAAALLGRTRGRLSTA